MHRILVSFRYADADHKGNKDDLKFTTGYIFLINNGALSWSLHKQSHNTVSMMESEYMAISDASREAIIKLQFYSDLNISTSFRQSICSGTHQRCIKLSAGQTHQYSLSFYPRCDCERPSCCRLYSYSRSASGRSHQSSRSNSIIWVRPAHPTRL